MPSRKNISGSIAGFLGTYSSRYSDYRGYWLFGQIYASIDGINIDLMHSLNKCSDPMIEFAFHLARRRFSEQFSKQGLDFF
jgi:hypothetical protein